MNRALSSTGSACLLLGLMILAIITDVGGVLHLPWNVAARVVMSLGVECVLLWLSALLGGFGLRETWPLLLCGLWVSCFPALNFYALRGIPLAPELADAFGYLPWWDSLGTKVMGAVLPLAVYPVRTCFSRASMSRIESAESPSER